ncbi:MAG TPA: hypothetical protein VGN81_15280 [Pseudonocardiaceae bacterium]|jgi:hypothetical protein
MGEFADQLFADLMAEYRPILDATDLPAPRRRRVTKPVWVSSGVASLGALLAAVLLVFTTGAPAYAVTQNPNGTITLTLNQLTALSDAAAALHPLGATNATGCQVNFGVAQFPSSTTDTVVIDPKKIPPGATGVLYGGLGNNGKPMIMWTIVPMNGTPACQALNNARNARNILGTGSLGAGARPPGK